MRRFIPLSKRGKPDARPHLSDHDGVPDWLRSTIVTWVISLISHRDDLGRTYWDEELIGSIERRMQVPLMAKNKRRGDLLMERVINDDEFALDLVDLLLGLFREDPYTGPPDAAVRLAAHLDEGNSVWRVEARDGRYCLTRRRPAEAEAALGLLLTGSGRAGEHLTAAWRSAFDRQANPGMAYKEAVRAVEAAAKPIVTPDDGIATLGKMISALRDKPGKWTTAWGSKPGDGIDAVIAMLELLWSGQVDRHGTDDETVPIHVSIEAARAAVQLAVPLVQWFTDGTVARAP